MEEKKSAALQQYEQDGYVIFPKVLDGDLIKEAREHLAWLMEKNPNLRPEHLGTELINDDPFWVRLVSDDRLLDIAEQFIGPNIALFASHYISKPPYDGQEVLWHQDGSYWPLEPMNVITLWLAVDDSLPENGCMRVIPKTHTMNLQEMQEKKDVDNVLGSEIDPRLVKEEDAVDCMMEAGGVSIHHPNIIHGSKANHSSLRRCGLTIRYIPTSTRITQEPWPSAFLLRGEAVPGINTYLPFPKYDKERHMAFKGCEAWA
ncbi:phytanoyl-CoA dioxygenase family protein [Litoribacterium kuwaitense]|uniref:phytanoyl-CoA dioxygenase family protein n=1 Tax=Litoribacterium kuwaitense TaxID=1398745 RepID=UPI001BA55CC0|nr:phytanoyl-CoA dioxygenase family protein [Litoribacterium kuwaitense]